MEAGKLVSARVGHHGQVEVKSSPSDLVTEVDRQSEQLIRSALQEHFPEMAVVGEEFGGHAGSDLVWYIDPIDGTTNFVHGLPGFTISIGLAKAGVPVAGVVYDPTADVLFSAAAGDGARRNGAPLHVCGSEELGGGTLVGTGVPSVEPGRSDAMNQIAAVAAVCPNIRNLGSAALHLCHVAGGAFAAFWQKRLHAWDACAGVIIVREAGGQVTDLQGKPWDASRESLVASNGPVHAALLDILRDAEKGCSRG